MTPPWGRRGGGRRIPFVRVLGLLRLGECLPARAWGMAGGVVRAAKGLWDGAGEELEEGQDYKAAWGQAEALEDELTQELLSISVAHVRRQERPLLPAEVVVCKRLGLGLGLGLGLDLGLGLWLGIGVAAGMTNMVYLSSASSQAARRLAPARLVPASWVAPSWAQRTTEGPSCTRVLGLQALLALR